jgi:hypothetical protein
MDEERIFDRLRRNSLLWSKKITVLLRVAE